MNAIRHHISGSRPAATSRTSSKWIAAGTGRKLTLRSGRAPGYAVDEMNTVLYVGKGPDRPRGDPGLLATVLPHSVPHRRRRVPNGRPGLARRTAALRRRRHCPTPRAARTRLLHYPPLAAIVFSPSALGSAAGGQRGDHGDHVRVAGGVHLDEAAASGSAATRPAGGWPPESSPAGDDAGADPANSPRPDQRGADDPW